MLNSNGVYSLIDKPTRVTGSSSTTQDHILTKNNSNIIYPCIFLSEISDHFPIGCLVAHHKINSNNYNQKSKTTKYVYRNESKFDNEQFRERRGKMDTPGKMVTFNNFSIISNF